MSSHLGMVVARMHGRLVIRPRSDVFHVYAGPLTPSGRYIPSAARTVCAAHTRRLSVLERDGSVLDLRGRRMCARCAARLSALARRAAQPIHREACEEFYAGITLADLVTATALAETVDETHRIGFVLGLRFPPPPLRRPASPVTDRDRFQQALFDVNAALLRRRRALAAAALTPEELEAARRAREQEAEDDARLMAAHRRATRVARVQDRADRGQYVAPWDRPLLEA